MYQARRSVSIHRAEKFVQDKRESAVRSWLRALSESIKQVLLVQPQSAYYRDVRRRLAELEIVRVVTVTRWVAERQ